MGLQLVYEVLAMGPPTWVAGFHTELVKEMQEMNTKLKDDMEK